MIGMMASIAALSLVRRLGGKKADTPMAVAGDARLPPSSDDAQVAGSYEA